jgi:1-acyl-sn-glycerol-3-phosphate acyltransferase
LTDTDQTTPRPGDFTGEWHPVMLRRMVTLARPFYKLWFRSEVRGLDSFPSGGALIVSNHSGGTTPQDVPILWLDFFEKFGYDRPLYTLGHDLLFKGPTAGLMVRMGTIRASRENAVKALRSGAAVIVFPGGDHEALRPTSQQATIDFRGRMGYVTTAIEAGVPIVPAVSIGGQETQWYLTRGEWLAKRLGLKRLTRAEQLAVSIGIPFGLSVGAINLPLPAKIVTQVLEPIDVTAEFGENPDVAEVDAHVRKVMQSALDDLAAQRRFPIIG